MMTRRKLPRPPTGDKRRRREDLVRPLIAALVAALVVIAVGTWAILENAQEANRAAATARTAALRAETNTARIELSELRACQRLQRERTALNRVGAIIYVVLTAASTNARENGRPQNGREYHNLGELPAYRPPTDCRLAVSHPGTYEPPDAIPFADLDPAILRNLLVRRLLNATP